MEEECRSIVNHLHPEDAPLVSDGCPFRDRSGRRLVARRLRTAAVKNQARTLEDARKGALLAEEECIAGHAKQLSTGEVERMSLEALAALTRGNAARLPCGNASQPAHVGIGGTHRFGDVGHGDPTKELGYDDGHRARAPMLKIHCIVLDLDQYVPSLPSHARAHTHIRPHL